MTQPPPLMPPPQDGPYGQQQQPPPYGPPPQGPYGGQYLSPPPPNLPPPAPPKRDRTKIVVTVAVFLAILVGAVVVIAVFSNKAKRNDAGEVTKEGQLTVFDLKEGDCFNNLPADDKQVMAVDAIPCAQPHDAEVLALVTVANSGSYPGVAKISEEVEKLCLDKIGDRVDRSPLSSRLDMFTLYPTAESWKQNDRGGTCVAAANDNAKLTAPVGK